VRIGVTIFADNTTTLAPEAVDSAGHSYKPNAFNVTRSYINIAGTVNSMFTFRITPDIARETSTTSALSGSSVFRLKYAYGQVLFDKWTGRFTETWLRFGQVPTSFLDGRDPIYRYRFQGTTMPERDGLLVSADTGVAFHTRLSDRADLQIALLNGEGYQKAEVNNEKALQTRVTFRPAPNSAPAFMRAFRAGVFCDDDHYMRDADRKRLILSATFEHPRLNAGADLVRTRDAATPVATVADGRGWSVFATPFFARKGKGPEALLRMDRLTPDRIKGEQRRRWIGGLSYWWTPAPGGSMAVMLDFEQLTVVHQLTPQPQQRRLTLHMLVTF